MTTVEPNPVQTIGAPNRTQTATIKYVLRVRRAVTVEVAVECGSAIGGGSGFIRNQTLTMENNFSRSPLEPGELFRGQAWSVYLENGDYFLNFLTGHLVSFEKRIPISKHEAEGLIKGELDADKVLFAHGAD